MIIFFILGLLLGAAAVFFAVQNVELVAVTFFGWQLEGSLSIIVALSILTGIAIAMLLTLPEFISNYLEYRRIKNKNVELEEELRKQRELTLFARKSSPSVEEISEIEKGAIEKHL